MNLPSRYVVGRDLGRGGMGVVYEADDSRLGRKVAIKVLQTGQDQPGRHRFAREARAASALNHPNIITIHDIDAADDGDFIVMESRYDITPASSFTQLEYRARIRPRNGIPPVLGLHAMGQVARKQFEALVAEIERQALETSARLVSR